MPPRAEGLYETKAPESNRLRRTGCAGPDLLVLLPLPELGPALEVITMRMRQPAIALESPHYNPGGNANLLREVADGLLGQTQRPGHVPSIVLLDERAVLLGRNQAIDR